MNIPCPRSKVWRSLLYIPVNNVHFISKALERGADAVILDLEDSIPHPDKDKAREHCLRAIDTLSGHGTDILVRINAPLRLAVRDLEAVIRPGLEAVLVPKVENADALRALGDVISELEHDCALREDSIGTVPLLESPAAVLSARDIAAALSRNRAMILGGEDFATECGLSPSAETLCLPKQQVAMAAKAQGLMALGLLDTLSDFSNPEQTLDLARRSARFGFDGATCIHPVMVPLLNAAFSPRPEDLDRARRTVSIMEDAWARGEGVALLDGRMIDRPVYERAKRLLARGQDRS